MKRAVGAALLAVGAGLSLVPSASVQAEEKAKAAPPVRASRTVASDDWSYVALKDLARRGLVHGFKDANFLNGRSLTRVEMASLVLRVLENIETLPLPSELAAASKAQPGPAATRGQVNPYDTLPTGLPLPKRGVRDAAFTEADLGTVKRLVTEYSVELAVIGADLEASSERIAALEGRVEQIEKATRDPEGPLQKAIRDVARIDKIRFSGFVQARYESFQNTRESDPRGGRRPVTDRFTLPRIRLAALARPTKHIGARFQLEGAGLAGGNSVALLDGWVAYYLSGDPATGHTVTLGQFIVPFGMEVPIPSSTREAPERARVARFFFPLIRDRGVKISSPTSGRLFYELGVFNGIHPGRPGVNANDNNNDKNVTGRVRATALKNLDLGVSFDIGTTLRTETVLGEAPRASGPASAENPYENKKLVLGADLQYSPWRGTTFRAEGMWGKANGTNARGYILELQQELNRKNLLVLKYDWFGADDLVLSPVGGGNTPLNDNVAYSGSLSNLAIGVVHRLDTSTRLKLFYEIQGRGRERVVGVAGPDGRVPWQGNILRFEVITLF